MFSKSLQNQFAEILSQLKTFEILNSLTHTF